MPTYDYECRKCRKVSEVVHGMTEKLKKCPLCGSRRVKRLITGAPIVVFKGGGWTPKLSLTAKERENNDLMNNDPEYRKTAEEMGWGKNRG